MSLVTSKSFETSSVYKELAARSIMTPDLREIEGSWGKQPIYVFVAGNYEADAKLQPNCLKKAKYLGRAISSSDSFQLKRLYTATGNGYKSVLFHNPKVANSLRARVLGDIFVIDPMQMVELDRLHRNNIEVKRTKNYFFLIDQVSATRENQKGGKTVHHPYVQAHTYSAIEAYWEHSKTSLSLSSKVAWKDKVCFSWVTP